MVLRGGKNTVKLKIYVDIKICSGKVRLLQGKKLAPCEDDCNMFWRRLLPVLTMPLMAFALSEQPYHTTGFIDEAGGSRTLLSYSSYSTSHFWNKHGKRLPTFNHFKRHSILLYSEYALNGCNSVFVNGGYSWVQEKLHKDSCSFEDLELGYKHLLAEVGEGVLTLQLTGIVPVGEKKAAIRYGRWGLEGGLLYSRCFDVCEKSGWYDLGAFYRYYSGFPSDQVRGYAACGLELFPCLGVIGSAYLDYGVDNGNSHERCGNEALCPNYRLFKGQIECYWDVFEHVRATIGAYHHFWGRNVGAGGGFVGGIWIVF